MSKHFEFECFDYRHLSPEQQARVRQEAIRQGHLARERAIRGFGLAVAARSTRAAAWARKAAMTIVLAVRSWAQRRADLAALHALEPRLLRDIGIDATEIESIVTYGPSDLTRHQARSRYFPLTPA